MREACFENLLQVLGRGVPERVPLFEFILNQRLYPQYSGYSTEPGWGTLAWARMAAIANMRLGYDYACMVGSSFAFPAKPVESKASRSMSDMAIIVDRASFDAYVWPDPDACDYSGISTVAGELPVGAKVIVYGPGGILENVMALAGYEGLCYLLADDPQLVEDLFNEVGTRFVRFYANCLRECGIGAILHCDDWGFKSQTMLPTALMRQYVFPWHQQIVADVHAAGYPAMLHSCGNLEDVMEDVIEVMRYDGKHSYEDTICPVETMYERYQGRIAILGGIDVDFLCRATPAEVSARARALLQRSAERGGYALGSGNSIPAYVPDENYFAMINS